MQQRKNSERMDFLASVPTRRHFQLPVKFISLCLSSAPSCLVTFIWRGVGRMVAEECLGLQEGKGKYA